MRLGIALLVVVGIAFATEIPSGNAVGNPVVAGNRIAIAAGVKLKGHIKEVKAAVNPDDQAVLGLAFDQISDMLGKKVNLDARVAGRG